MTAGGATDAGGPTPPLGSEHQALVDELQRLMESWTNGLRSLGTLVHSSASTLSRVKNGQVFPEQSLVMKLAEVLGGDIQHLKRMWAAAQDARQPANRELLDLEPEGDGRAQLEATARSLRRECDQRNWSVRKLAKATGHSQQTLATLFQGHKIPPQIVIGDVLDKAGITGAEARKWTNRFARAAKAIRETSPGMKANLSPDDLEPHLAPLRKRATRAIWAASIATTAAVIALLIASIAFWIAEDSYGYSPIYSTDDSDSVNDSSPTTEGTPLPPGSLTATVLIGESSSATVHVFENPSVSAAVKSDLPAQTEVLVVCQVLGTEQLQDTTLTEVTPEDARTWFQVSLSDKILGYVPKPYLTLNGTQRPVLPPPLCPSG